MRNVSITQLDFFDYTPNSSIGDLSRLLYCIEQIPFQSLIDEMNFMRGNGRNDYPNEVMFRTFIAQFLFQRLEVSAMRRELSGNPTLRDLIGINDKRSLSLGKKSCVPSDDVFSNFITNLTHHYKCLLDIFDDLRKTVFELIPTYGYELSGDGKYLDSYAPNQHSEGAKPGHRGEHDATYSKKERYTTNAHGDTVKKAETHYGFRKHTLVDASTELPVASVVLPANEDEKKAMTNFVLPSIPDWLWKRTEYVSFDRGYDSIGFISALRSYSVKPIIDKRILSEKNKLRPYPGAQNVYYNEAADIFYYDESLKDEIDHTTELSKRYVRMKYLGYDKTKGKKNADGSSLGVLKYRYQDYTVYIDISYEPRFFTEVARDSKKFARLYNHRTSVERYHGRMDVCFGFETHTIRGLEKMRIYTLMGDIIMLAMALAHHKRGETNYASIFDFDPI